MTEARSTTVLVYSDDPQIRERVQLAVGVRPASDLGRVAYEECEGGLEVVQRTARGGIDLCILDGEAWPTGGMGICRQLKDEVQDCPPVLIVVGRRDDAWLASWSRADAVVTHPIDPMVLARTTAELLRRRTGLATPSRP